MKKRKTIRRWSKDGSLKAVGEEMVLSLTTLST